MRATRLPATIGSLFFVQAYRHAEANIVAPFEYTSLLGAMLNGIVFFGDFPNTYTWVGAALVVGAGVWMFQRERSK